MAPIPRDELMDQFTDVDVVPSGRPPDKDEYLKLYQQKLRQFSAAAVDVDAPPPYTERPRSPRSPRSPLVPALCSVEVLSSLTVEQHRRLASRIEQLFYEPHEIIEKIDARASHLYHVVEVS